MNIIENNKPEKEVLYSRLQFNTPNYIVSRVYTDTSDYILCVAYRNDDELHQYDYLSFSDCASMLLTLDLLKKTLN